MWAKPTKKILKKLEENRNKNAKTDEGDIIILAHFFMGANDWYIVDYDPETEIMFGFCVLNGNMDFAEWGTGFYQEDPKNSASKRNNLMNLKLGFLEVDFDRHFEPTPFEEIKKELEKRYR